MIRRFPALFVACLLMFSLPSARHGVDVALAEAQDLDSEYRDPNNSGNGVQVVILKDEPLGGGLFSYISGGSAPPGTCRSISDPACRNSLAMLYYRAILQPCTSNSQLDCIGGFGSIQNETASSSGTFLKTFPSAARHGFNGDSSLKLPAGGAATIWSLPNMPHAGGNQYMVRVYTDGRFSNGSFQISEFGAEIVPIELVPDPCTPLPNSTHGCENEGRGFYNVIAGGVEYDEAGNELPRKTIWGEASRVSNTPFDCLVIAEDKCARRHAFPKTSRFFLTLRLSQSPIGWLHGRIAKPDVSIKPIGGSAVELTVAGETVKTPVVAIESMWANLPPSLKEAYRESGGFRGAPSRTRNLPLFNLGPEVRNAISAPTSYSATGMSELIAWLPYIGDKSTADISKWTLRSLSDSELAGASSCFSSKAQLNGLVMTNATQYSAGPPTFDRAAGSLDYKVAAPHYTSGGSVFLGTYDLVMRSDVARCIYGFSKAPLNASISVVDNEGVTTTATKLVSERDGWIRIAAYGFGFSSPTIKVQLTQDAPAATKTTGKKVTITCKKGKLVKKVTGLKPTCPKGYKKA